MNLIHSKSKEVVKIGDTVFSFTGQKYVVVGMSKPNYDGATGRIYVKNEKIDSCGFFPNVVGCEWTT
tara:strand:- start:141 stop:341 length:201 start_codon:yes stop_codon:yes gene_type:complete